MTRFSSLISVFVCLIGFVACGTSEVVSVESDAGTVALDSEGRTPTGDVAGKDHDYQVGSDEVAHDIGPSHDASPDGGEDSEMEAAEETVTADEATVAEPDFHQDSKDIKADAETVEADVVVIVLPDIQPDTDTVVIDTPSPESSDELGEDGVEEAAEDTAMTEPDSHQDSNDVVDTEAEAEPVCVPDCLGKQCGPDGCGSSCGVCDDNNQCIDDVCQNGLCINTPLADWTPCELDGLTCSVDNCQNGVCAPVSYLTADFDSGEMSQGWYLGIYGNGLAVGNVTKQKGATSGEYALVIGGAASPDVMLTSSALFLPTGHTAHLTFDYKSDDDGNTFEHLTVFVCKPNTIDWTCDEMYPLANMGSVAEWAQYSFDLSSYQDGFYTIIFDFEFPSDLYFWVAIDSIEIGCPDS